MSCSILSVVFLGVKATPIEVQVHISNGLPSLNIVGLADKSVSESKERIRAAFSSIGLDLPPKRITINLSPSNLIKEGSHFDLPIALGVLSAMNILDADLKDYIALGELSLNGDIKSVNGILPALILAIENKQNLIFPHQQFNEVSIFKSRLSLLPVKNLQDIINHFKNEKLITLPENIEVKESPLPKNYYDFKDIKGQEAAKRAVEIAAAGSHNLLMIGPPGVGKSMLASSIQGILPPLSKKEMLEVSLIYSVTGMLGDNNLITKRPFRSPHHTSSEVSLIGGGKKATAGEITLAHNGILFLDELAEFNKHTLNSLREPLETGNIHIARANHRVSYPANFQLISAMNPCPCGYLGDVNKQCSKAPNCSVDYQNKISGPLFDRIDICVELSNVDVYKIDETPTVSSCVIKEKVIKAKKIQEERYKNTNYSSNSNMDEEFFNINKKQIDSNEKSYNLMVKFTDKFKISMRGYNRVIKLARTIADLDEDEIIQPEHLAEAISYRKITHMNKKV